MTKKFLILCFALISFSLLNAATIVVNADITANTTWTNNNVYVLQGGFIYVTNNATLTIQPGTLVKGQASSLVITRGAKIMAQGTITQPIVFTSNQPAGSRNAADWGGVLLLGKAPINDPAGQRTAEGGIDPVKGLYGGTDPNDNSGVMQYCRIEYAGIAYQPNNETNGLTLAGVGAGTTIDHIQVSHGGDDSFEWFGGNVNAKYLIAYRGLDDDFDTDYGFSGKVQFAVGLRDSLVADISGSNGFESDNDATGTTNTPNTNATFSNVTLFGPKRVLTTPVNANYKRGAHLRRSTQQDVYNSVLTGWIDGLKIEGTNTGNNVISGALQFKNNILAGMSGNMLDTTGLPASAYLTWFNSNANITYPNPQDVQAGNPYNYTAPAFIPLASSPVLTGADFNSTNLQNSFFTPVNYRGAFGSNDWTACWSEFNPQTQTYTTVPINYVTGTLPSITVVGNTTICQGGSVTLNAPSGYTSYNWSNGATTQSITVSAAGTYNVVVTNNRGCPITSANSITVIVKPLPTAIASTDDATTFCTGGSALLKANMVAGYAYQWYKDGVSLSTAGATPYYNATTAAAYTVKTTYDGCSNTSAPIAITVNTNPTATITGSTGFCIGGNTTLTASITTGATYQWYQGGGLIPNATNSTLTVTASGSYTVEISKNGCSATSTALAVTANAIPVASVTPAGNAYICPNNTVTLTATNVTGATYQWYKNGQAITGSTANTITVNQGGGYFAAVSKAGCTANLNAVSVTAQNQPTITTPPTTTVCQGATIVLNASSGSAYQWMKDGVNISAATAQAYTASASGNYSVKVGVCTSNPITITINPLPTATVTPTGNTTFCLGNSVVLNATTATNQTYQWRKGTANIPTGTSATYTATSGGSYSVRITNTTTGCNKTSTALTVVANAVPVTPTITRSGATLTSNASTGNQWYKDNVLLTGATANTLTITGVGCYRTVVTNTNSCASPSDTICVTSAPIDVVNDNTQNSNQTTTRQLPSTDNLIISPNPNTGNFDVLLTHSITTHTAIVEVLNLMGQLIYHQQIPLDTTETKYSITLANATNGIYIVRIKYDDKIVERKMIINQ